MQIFAAKSRPYKRSLTQGCANTIGFYSNSIQPILTSPSSSLSFPIYFFGVQLWQKYQVFRVQAAKILSLLFDLALLLYSCCFSRSPRHKQVNDDINLHGMINKQYFCMTIF